MPESSQGNQIVNSRSSLLSDLWTLVKYLRRNGNVIIFNHFKAHIVWIGIMDAKATEEELLDFMDKRGGLDENV